jgi:hypothetical protein
VVPVSCSLAIAFAASTFAAQHDAEKKPASGGAPPAVVAGETIVATATVKAVDKMNRKVTFEGPEGNMVMVSAGPEVKNFDQIAVGDKLMIEYTEAIAAAIDPAGGAPAAGSQIAVETAPPGAKPAMVASETVELRAKILEVDKAKRKVAVQGPAGKKRIFRVGKEVERFDELKPGEDVVVRYTEAIAIKITSP